MAGRTPEEPTRSPAEAPAAAAAGAGAAATLGAEAAVTAALPVRPGRGPQQPERCSGGGFRVYPALSDRPSQRLGWRAPIRVSGWTTDSDGVTAAGCACAPLSPATAHRTPSQATRPGRRDSEHDSEDPGQCGTRTDSSWGLLRVEVRQSPGPGGSGPGPGRSESEATQRPRVRVLIQVRVRVRAR